MPSSDESDTNDMTLERETQFVYQSGDEDVLWEVQEITAERGNKYKVKWAGINPATGKPWAQSWVAKHDCTDDLVVEWRKKKRPVAGKKRGRLASMASGTPGTSRRTSSSTKMRRSASKATSLHLDPVKERVSPPPKQPTAKRKRQFEPPATSSSGPVQTDEQGESSRPRKKQKTLVDVLLPPISSDEEGEHSVVPNAHAGVMPPRMNNDASINVSDKDDGSPPKGKGKSECRSDARSKGTAVSSRTPVVRVPRLKVATIVPRRKERVTHTKVLSFESEDSDEELRPPRSRRKAMSKQKSSSEPGDNPPDKEAKPAVHPIKIGPPRGVKRGEMSKESRLPNTPRPSRTKSRKDGSAGEYVPVEESDHEVLSFGSPLLLQQNAVGNRTSPPRQISIPRVSPSARPCSPGLSPGAKARLELFDRMMADPSQPDAAPLHDVPGHVPDDTHLDFNNTDLNNIHDTNDILKAHSPPTLSPPKLRSKPKSSESVTRNGLIVPETESSGNSQSPSQRLLKPPRPSAPPLLARDQSPHKSIDLPTIAVVVASATSSSASPQNAQKPLSPTNRPSKRPIYMIASGTFRSRTDACSRIDDSEAPPSSIESFTSPRRIDKGKQKAVEDDWFQSSLSEREEDGEHQKRRTQRKITDSVLKKRGKELFDQAQLAREAERQKNRKPKRLKTVDQMVNGMVSSPSKGSALPFANEAENNLELRLEDVVDLSGAGNSATLDTPEYSEVRPLSKEERERLRIELRQEEEENTQEAMGIYLAPPKKETKVTPNEDSQPSPSSPKNFPFSGQAEDVDHIKQPSTDLLLASVVVQPSQGQRHEDVDTQPSPVILPASSPPRLIPQKLTDSPRRRLGEALSLLNAKSEEIQRLERDLANERKNLQGLRAELAELQQSSESTGSIRTAWEVERAQWTQERSLWEMQRKEMSEEKEKLSARLTELSDTAVRAEEARIKVSELEAERAAWVKGRDTILYDMPQRSEEQVALTKVREEYDQDRIKWEADRTLWAEENAKWETERAAFQEKQETLLHSIDGLTASVESMRTAKISAENDRDFLREQYMQASGFVGSIREENAELEKRVKIAEGQAQEGVAAIKALFEGRVKALQADVDRWKGLTELLQGKDRRTNDELRLRAAQVPELRELCDRLDEANKSLGADIRKLGRAQQRGVYRQNKLFYEILLLKKERASLRSKLSKFARTSDSSTQQTSRSMPAPPAIVDPESMDPNDLISQDPTPQSLESTFDEPALFPCMWRPQWRDQCQQVFDTKEDLERHMQTHFRDLLTQ